MVTANALKSLWIGTCKITCKETYKEGNITKQRDVTYCENEPCRLSFKDLQNSTTSESGTVANVGQLIKLFLSPTITIPSGSKIEVTQNGVTTLYKRSGQPLVHTNHQEVVLALYEDKA